MDTEQKHKLKILIIEDDPINMLIITEMLKLNYLLFHALNSEVAYELAQKIKFDAILIDLFLGDDSPDGIEVFQHIKNHQSEDCIKIALTSSLRPADRSNMLKEGFMYHFQKPISKNELINAIEKRLEQHLI